MLREDIVQSLRKAAPSTEFLQDASMKEYTTFRIGGACDLLALPSDPHEARNILLFCKEHELPLTVIGRGSNLLIADEGIRGVVMRFSGKGAHCEVDGERMKVTAATPLTYAANAALAAGLTGMEFAFGIPGNLGGSVAMNAGAYSGEMSHITEETTVLGPDGDIYEIKNGEHEFAYRKSYFTTHPGTVVLSSWLHLKQGDKQAIAEKMRVYMERRVTKQPLSYPSAGSVFKRPPNDYAGRLIDECGLKGHSVGGALVSPMHAGFIVNAGGATCEDVKRLIEHIQRVVYERSGVLLECEIKMLPKV